VSGLQVLCKFPKLLILKAFIIEKNLDTPTLPLLTFAQKVLTVLPPLELFSLERRSHLLPGGFFVYENCYAVHCADAVHAAFLKNL
jgi:hypothetical protein